MQKPWKNDITGYVPGTVGVKTSNDFGGEGVVDDVSTLSTFQWISPSSKTWAVVSALCCNNAITIYYLTKQFASKEIMGEVHLYNILITLLFKAAFVFVLSM